MLESRQIRGATTLNRRNKTALCATLACVGLILLLGGGMRTAVGVGFLGASFSWALGSNYRPLHWLFVASGVLLLIPVVVDGFLWPRNKADLIKSDTDLVQGDRDYLKTTLAPRAQDYSDKKDWERDWSQYLKDESQHRNEFLALHKNS